MTRERQLSSQGLPAVMQIIDTLAPGGLERVAVNLANLLPRTHYRSFLCTTRRDGALADLLAPDVGRLSLARRSRVDVLAVRRLASFVAAHDVKILHAHGSAVFVAVLASLLPPHPAVLWHVHYGRYSSDDDRALLHRLLSYGIDGIVTVNAPLADWAARRLSVAADRIHYIPNFVVDRPAGERPADLPGEPGSRIVCVASLRSPKDHQTLIAAMADVVRAIPAAHLLLVGNTNDLSYTARVRDTIQALGLADRVSVLGHREDVAAILRGSDVGVLSSTSEGFPLALIEYGGAALGCVSTAVGQCGEVLDDGRAGVLVAPQNPAELARELIGLLKNPSRRRALGERLRERVEATYAATSIMTQICQVYESLFSERPNLTAARVAT